MGQFWETTHLVIASGEAVLVDGLDRSMLASRRRAVNDLGHFSESIISP